MHLAFYQRTRVRFPVGVRIYRCDPCGVVPLLGRGIIVGSTPTTYTKVSLEYSVIGNTPGFEPGKSRFES